MVADKQGILDVDEVLELPADKLMDWCHFYAIQANPEQFFGKPGVVKLDTDESMANYFKGLGRAGIGKLRSEHG